MIFLPLSRQIDRVAELKAAGWKPVGPGIHCWRPPQRGSVLYSLTAAYVQHKREQAKEATR